jgi:hypothetical protein
VPHPLAGIFGCGELSQRWGIRCYFGGQVGGDTPKPTSKVGRFPPKPSGVIGENDIGEGGGKGKDGRSCANLGLTHLSNPYIFSGYLV